MPVQVHDTLLRKRYVASRCSFSYCVWFVSAVAIVVVPFLIAFGSGSFWLKEKHYHAQPDVTFKNEMILVVDGTSASTGPFQAMWTTSSTANSLVGSALRAPVVRTSSEDSNRDGATDAVVVDIEVPRNSDETFTNVQLLSFVEVKFHDPAKLTMDAVVHAHAGGILPASGASVVGDVVFRQKAPLLVKGGYLAPYLHDSLVSLDEAESLVELLPSTILRKAALRNYTVDFVAPLSHWDVDVAGVANNFAVHVEMRVPPALVYATPSASEIFKFGWVQYVACLTFVWVIAREIRQFLFEHRLLGATIVSDANARKRL